MGCAGQFEGGGGGAVWERHTVQRYLDGSFFIKRLQYEPLAKLAVLYVQ